MLQEHVAPSAFHNSKQRIDPPRCLAHTREAVLEELFDWIVGKGVQREAWDSVAEWRRGGREIRDMPVHSGGVHSAGHQGG